MKRRKLLPSLLLVALAIFLVYIFALDEDQQVLNAIKHGLKGVLRAL